MPWGVIYHRYYTIIISLEVEYKTIIWMNARSSIFCNFKVFKTNPTLIFLHKLPPARSLQQFGLYLHSLSG
jgi:hypothetical protein